MSPANELKFCHGTGVFLKKTESKLWPHIKYNRALVNPLPLPKSSLALSPRLPARKHNRQLLLRCTAMSVSQAQAGLNESCWTFLVTREHNNATVSGQELANLFLHVGSGSLLRRLRTSLKLWWMTCVFSSARRNSCNRQETSRGDRQATAILSPVVLGRLLFRTATPTVTSWISSTHCIMKASKTARGGAEF